MLSEPVTKPTSPPTIKRPAPARNHKKQGMPAGRPRYMIHLKGLKFITPADNQGQPVEDSFALIEKDNRIIRKRINSVTGKTEFHEATRQAEDNGDYSQGAPAYWRRWRPAETKAE